MPEGWGFTKRPAPTVHGKIAYTRGASGTKAIVGEAIELGVFLPITRCCLRFKNGTRIAGG